ncbi:endoglucanase 13, partial [Striga asiatica]
MPVRPNSGRTIPPDPASPVTAPNGLVPAPVPVPPPPAVVAFKKGSWTFSYMRLSMLNPSGEDSMLLIALSVFRIISHINSGSLRTWASSGFRSIISRIRGLLIIKLRIISGLFVKLCIAGSPLPNKPDGPVPPNAPKPSPGNKGAPVLTTPTPTGTEPPPGGTAGLLVFPAVVEQMLEEGQLAHNHEPYKQCDLLANLPSTLNKTKIKNPLTIPTASTSQFCPNTPLNSATDNSRLVFTENLESFEPRMLTFTSSAPSTPKLDPTSAP